MNWPAALPVAVLRVTRTAAGRRALRVAVLVGGLFAFGFLCGERAHAAEGTSSVRVDAVRPVVEKVGSPAGGLVAAVTEGPAEVLAAEPTLPALPALPEVSALPVLPELPELPVLPELSAMPTLPEIPEPPVLPGLPVSPTVPSSPASPAPPASASPNPPSSPTAPSSQASPSLPKKTPPTHAAGTDQGEVSYGPRFLGRVGGAVDVRGVVAAGERVGMDVSRASVRQAPGDTPNGVPHGALGDRAVVAGGGPRHGGQGDGHAVAPNQRTPVCFALVLAPVAAGAEAGNRYRDIPVSPA